jgi:thiol-disulfide isomerase/thioredoxin
MNIKVYKILSFLVAILLFINVSAQEKSSPAEDFTLTDVNGNVENLYNELAEGKTVILYFFSCSCIHCYLDAPILDSIYRQFGSGNNQLQVWGIADENFNNADIQLFIDSTDITFPCFATGHATDVFSLYGAQYTPQIKMICDYLVSESLPNNQIVENLNYCFPTEIQTFENKSPIINIIGGKISIESTKSVSFVGLYDITGRLIKSNFTGRNNETSIHDLILGNLYVISVIFADGTTHSEKIIIK